MCEAQFAAGEREDENSMMMARQNQWDFHVCFTANLHLNREFVLFMMLNLVVFMYFSFSFMHVASLSPMRGSTTWSSSTSRRGKDRFVHAFVGSALDR